MSEFPAREKLERVSYVIASPSGEPVRITGKMPSPEFYPDEMCRLSTKAVRGTIRQNLGWSDELGVSVSFKEKTFSGGPAKYQLGEYKDASLPPTDPPILIRLIFKLPPVEDPSGLVMLPTELKFYTPATNNLEMIRFDNLIEDDLRDQERFVAALELQRALDPLEIAQKDRFMLYSILTYAAGERLPQ